MTQADETLEALMREGAIPAPKVDVRRDDEVSPATEALRRRIVAKVSNGHVTANNGLLRIRYTHEDCIDRILASPGITQKALAQVYGMSEAWISIIVNCDAFKVALAARRDELLDPALTASLNERYGALAQASVDRLLKRIVEDDTVPDKTLLEAAALGAKAMGMGQPAAPTGQQNANDHLAAIAHRLIDLNRPSPAAQVIDAQTRQVD